MGRMPERCGGRDRRRGLHRRGAALLAVLAAPPAAAPLQAQASGDSATYTVTFQGNWTTASTPGGVVSGAHFTTLIGAVHNALATFWQPGGLATPGVEQVAELGFTPPFRREIEANPNAVSVIMQGVGSGGTGAATFEVTVTRSHPLVTLLSMIGPSPDWFVGISGRSLLDGEGRWLPGLEIDLFPYDAGTEEGTGFSLSNPATSPRQPIMSIRDMGRFSDVRMARLTFVRSDDPTVSAEAGSAAEGSPVPFTVGLSRAVDADVVLAWKTTDGTATAGDDYTAVTGREVTVPAGATAATFAVPTTDDDLVETDETFTVAVAASGPLPRGVTVPDGLQATGVIEDDDSRASGFTDDPVVAGGTVVRAVHLTELRERIDALRATGGLQPFAYADPTIRAGVTRVRALHLTELRAALDEAYDAAGRARPRYTGAVQAGVAVRALHVNELRRATQALE